MRSVMARSSRISSGSTSRVPLGMRSTIVPGLRPRSGAGRDVSYPLDSRPELPEALVNALVAAVDLTDIPDLCLAFGRQRRDQHGHPGSDVGERQALTAQPA